MKNGEQVAKVLQLNGENGHFLQSNIYEKNRGSYVVYIIFGIAHDLWNNLSMLVCFHLFVPSG